MQIATPTDRFLGVCQPCIRPIGVELVDHRSDYTTIHCPDCSGLVTVERLYGTATADPCAGECMGAAGPACSCSCGGKNHGGLYFKAGEALASAVASYREKTKVRRAAAVKRSEARAAKKAADTAEAWATYRAENDDVLSRLDSYDGTNSFLQDLARQHGNTRQLSDRQLDAAARAFERDAKFAAQRQAEAAAGKPVPTGRQTVEGVVVSTRIDDGPFGTQLKGLVKCDGFKVWGTIPTALVGSVPGGIVGSKVRFVATLEPSKDDPSFGFWKRPTKAEVLDEGLEVAA